MKKKFHLIANAHLDPVWQWRVPEGLSLVKSTFRSALDRMNEFPDYTFTSACASYYKWIKLNEPEMFEEIKQRVKEGRWAIVGGMWVQPDCNIPSGEAFCRHMLYSQKFFKENFGFIVKTGYNVDSFGHNGMLPQLLKKSGIDNYIYQRPDNRTEKPNLPFDDLHYWQSPDGSVINAFRVPDGYGGDVHEQRLVDHYYNKNQPMMVLFGVGNHGGGPSKEHLKNAEKLICNGDFKYSTPDTYFEEAQGTEMPLVNEDLQHHASGCYSANSRIKNINRRAETELVTAEKLDVLANIMTGSALHNKQIEAAWERVMFNQFHDILAGCSVKEAYFDAENSYGYARETALDVNTFAAQRITWRIKTTDFLDADDSEMRGRMWYKEGEGSPMVVFNLILLLLNLLRSSVLSTFQRFLIQRVMKSRSSLCVLHIPTVSIFTSAFLKQMFLLTVTLYIIFITKKTTMKNPSSHILLQQKTALKTVRSDLFLIKKQVQFLLVY